MTKVYCECVGMFLAPDACKGCSERRSRFERQLAGVSNDVQLSNVCRSIEERLKKEHASLEAWVEYEEAAEEARRRIFAGARAG